MIDAFLSYQDYISLLMYFLIFILLGKKPNVVWWKGSRMLDPLELDVFRNSICLLPYSVILSESFCFCELGLLICKMKSVVIRWFKMCPWSHSKIPKKCTFFDNWFHLLFGLQLMGPRTLLTWYVSFAKEFFLWFVAELILYKTYICLLFLFACLFGCFLEVIVGKIKHVHFYSGVASLSTI